MQDFSRLPGTLSAALSEKGYVTLTPVQTSVIDASLRGKDLLVSAQTGSGKTVGFGLAIAPDLLDADGQFGRPAVPLAVVIAPTRELALQVRREFDWLFAKAGIVTASAVGGMDARTERRALERGAHIVVATPGRLRDHTARGNVDLSALKAVILDEADEMLDMGFAEDLEFILDQTPSYRRTLMFSATVPPGIAKLAKSHQKDDAVRLVVGNSKTQHADISYSALNIAPSDIEKAIINVLIYHDARTAIIFANTRSMVARLAAKFSNRGFKVVSLSGELSQAERGNAMQALRDGRANVCVATDVAARGIDLPGLDLVIHADLPSNAETLLHRSGRTGRAGLKGRSVLVVPGRFRSKAQRLLKTAKVEAEWGKPPSAKDVLAREEERIITSLALSEPLSPEEIAFAARLLADRTSEQIAAAYLRLYRERHSAPEILGEIPEPEKRPKVDHSDFGPSTWFSLSLGRKDRAEPRWLLPMLCRNAGLERASIGALRVQYQETFVEIASAAVPVMKAELGEGLSLEQGATLTELEGTPDFDASPKGPPSAPRDQAGPQKHRKGHSRKDGPSKDRADKHDANRERSDQVAKPARAAKRFQTDDRTKPVSEKSVSKPQASPNRSSAGQDKQAKHAAPAKDGKPGRKEAKTQKRNKDAGDISKSLRPNKKARHALKNKGKTTVSARGRVNKGGDARPFRKPSRKA